MKNEQSTRRGFTQQAVMLNSFQHLHLNQSSLKEEKILNQVQDDNRRGFTLIELLVVVLIIGILAAVAVPQYQKTVEKSKAMQGLTLLKSLYDASVVYYLANGSWPTSITKLDLDFSDANTLEHWYIQFFESDLRNSSRGFNHGIRMTYKSGPYTGAGFVIYYDRDSNYAQLEEQKQIMCYECSQSNCKFRFSKERGTFCQKIMSGTFLTAGDGNRFFHLN